MSSVQSVAGDGEDREATTATLATPSRFGELFKHVGDATGENHYPHHSLDCDQRYINQPFVLAFTHLTYSVKLPKKLFSGKQSSAAGTRILLNSVSGEAREGEIMAILGASGSGKSTLIDALAGGIRKESLQGCVTLNGERVDEGTGQIMKVISAYVRQDDLLFPMLTVEETLMFSAEFRLPRSLSKSMKKTRVQALMEQLGLCAVAKTIIGDEVHRGISGGERRRVSIGIDIIHDPIILFLDEPTSGLDSTSAFMVVNVLRKIARTGSIVIMSIHQPSTRILGLLDHLIFLSSGNCVFKGTPRDLQPFFTDFGRPIPEKENRAEFALDTIREMESIPNGTSALVEHNKIWQEIEKRRRESSPLNGGGGSLKEAISASISRGKLVSGSATGGSAVMKTFANPFWVEMGVLCRRGFLNMKRTPKLFLARLVTVLGTGIILATIFWQLDTSPRSAQERLGFFAFAMTVMFYTCSDALPVFQEERNIFMRETAYNAYRRSSYVLSNALISIPSFVILSVGFACTTFFAVNLAGGAKGFGFYVVIILASFWSGISFISFLSGIIHDRIVSFTVTTSFLSLHFLFCGFFIARNRIPEYWLWFHYLTLSKYPYEAALRNEFNDPTRCFQQGVELFDNSPLGRFPTTMKLKLLKSMSDTLDQTLSNSTCFTTGVDILNRRGVNDLSKWNAVLVTVAWGFFFRILFYFTLVLGSKNKRK